MVITAALKHRIRNPETETETECGIRERRFQAIDLKKIYISNDNEISKHALKKDTNE